jgi:acyl-CoA thioesterase-1
MCKYISALIILLSIIGCSKSDGELRAGFEAGKYQKIVAFGDSIVEGYKQPEGWPEILERDLGSRYGGIQVKNEGVSGNTAADGLRRLQKDVLAHQPDLVLISFGLNDMKNGVSAAHFKEELTEIILEVSSSGALPVLLTTTRLQQGASVLARLNPAPYNDAMRNLADERGLFLIDVNDEFKGLNTAKYLMDAAHPNPEGYRRLADIIRKGLIGE